MRRYFRILWFLMKQFAFVGVTMLLPPALCAGIANWLFDMPQVTGATFAIALVLSLPIGLMVAEKWGPDVPG